MKSAPLFKSSIMLSAGFAAMVAMPALAAPLASTSLAQLSVPTNCVPPASAGCGPNSQPTAFGAITPTIATTVTPPAFTGTWGAGVAPAWVGTFTGTGPYPSGATGPSTSTWNFSGLGPQGFLPAGTFVGLGDLDGFGGGGATEKLDLTAFDAVGQLITSAWLDDVFFVSSQACSTDCVQSAMPQYIRNSTSGTYSFDGANVTALNPTLTAWVVTNRDILQLTVNKSTLNNGLVLAAPTSIPEPGSLLLVGLSLAVLTFAKIFRTRDA